MCGHVGAITRSCILFYLLQFYGFYNSNMTYILNSMQIKTKKCYPVLESHRTAYNFIVFNNLIVQRKILCDIKVLFRDSIFNSKLNIYS